jgi:hypothetical protein
MRHFNTSFIIFFICIALLSHAVAQGPFSPAQDSTPLPAGQLELVNISGSSHFTVEAPHAGDTLSYIITVEWENPKIPVTVLAPESLSFSGLKKTGASTQHKKIAVQKASGVMLKNSSLFIFNLKALTSGSAKAQSARLPYFSAVSQEREYVYISPSLITVLPAITPISQTITFKLILGLLAVSALMAGVYFVVKRFKQGSKPSAGQTLSFEEEVKDLKSRIQVADSRQLLQEAEKVCVKYLRSRLPGTQLASTDALIDSYLTKYSEEHKTQWQLLKNDFELANFGGGQKVAHELANTIKNIKTCLNIREDENHE